MGVEQLSEEEVEAIRQAIETIEGEVGNIWEQQTDIFEWASELQRTPFIDKDKVGKIKGTILAERTKRVLRIDKKGRR